MADNGTLSLLYDAFKEFSQGVERLLGGLDTFITFRGTKPTEGCPSQHFECWRTSDEILEKCYQLGVASISVSHGIITSLSNLDEASIGGVAYSQRHVVDVAIWTAIAECVEVCQVIETAKETTTTLKGPMGIKTALDWTFRDNGYPHSPCNHADYLRQLWCSIDLQPFVNNQPALGKIIAALEGHIIRVCLFGLSWHRAGEFPSAAAPTSPLMKNLYREGSKEDNDIGILSKCLHPDRWESKDLKKMLNTDIICALMFLEAHVFGDLSDMGNSLVFGLLSTYASIFTSLIDAFRSTLAIEQHLNDLITTNTYLLASNPLAALRPLSLHRDAVRKAVTSARNDINLVIPMLEQLLGDLLIDEHLDDPLTGGLMGGTLAYDWRAQYGGDPEPFKCIKCIFENLLAYSKQILSERMLGPGRWVWATSEPTEGGTLLENIQFLLRTHRGLDWRQYRLRIFSALCSHPQQQDMRNQTDPQPQPPSTTQVPSADGLELPRHDPHHFWSHLLTLASKQDGSNSPGRLIPLMLERSYYWRPCKYKQQLQFAKDGKASKHHWLEASGAAQGNFPQPTVTPNSSKQARSQRKRADGILQGDWSF